MMPTLNIQAAAKHIPVVFSPFVKLLLPRISRFIRAC